MVDDDMYDNMESISMVEDVNASAMAPEVVVRMHVESSFLAFWTLCK